MSATEEFEPVLALEDVSVGFSVSGRRGLRSRWLQAVDHVNLSIVTGEVVAVVGESGSGKSTLARAALATVPLTSGRVMLDGKPFSEMPERHRREVRADIQMIFQDPFSSLDPTMTVGDSLAEPLVVHRHRLSRAERGSAVENALEVVGLPRTYSSRYPHQLSGGQRQRVAIARALILQPKVLICDEAVSALDMSSRNQVINVLRRVQRRFDTAIVFIAHDLSITRTLAERVVVMYLGAVVESGPVQRVLGSPAHPYTQALVSAIPNPDPARRGATERIVLHGELPSPVDRPAGCRFHTRCPYVMDICRTDAPPSHPIRGGGIAACHLYAPAPAQPGTETQEPEEVRS